jgi:alpha-glucoside transport system substrate-binding protein
MRRSRHIATAAVVGSLSLLAAACGGGSSGGSGGSGGGGGGGGGGGATPSNFGGKNITIWASVDPPVIAGLQAQLNAQLQGKGINAKITRVTNINQLIVTKVQANAAPDIALIPQPGVIQDLAKRGKVTALDKILDINSLKQSMIPGTLDATTFNGKLDAILVSANVKGLVFYPKQVWD